MKSLGSIYRSSKLVETCDGHAPCAPCVVLLVHMLNRAHGSFCCLRLFGSDIGRLDNHDVIISGNEVAVGKVMK